MDLAQATDSGLIVQRRTLPVALQREALALASENDLRVVLQGTTERLGDELGQVLDDCPTLVADLRAQLARFTVLAGTSLVRFRLERIVSDACRRWHADNVALRLLCTYFGPGTQILPMPEAGPVLVGDEPPTTATAWSVSAGDVVVLPGRRHPTAAPVVHRSPPISSTRDVRLLLVIDDGGAFRA